MHALSSLVSFAKQKIHLLNPWSYSAFTQVRAANEQVYVTHAATLNKVEFKQLLEAAAKAAGYEEIPVEGWTLHPEKGMRWVDCDHEFVRFWNPLKDTWDAMNLADIFGIDVIFAEDGMGKAWKPGSPQGYAVAHGDNPEIAVNLAILLAATR